MAQEPVKRLCFPHPGPQVLNWPVSKTTLCVIAGEQNGDVQVDDVYSEKERGQLSTSYYGVDFPSRLWDA